MTELTADQLIEVEKIVNNSSSVILKAMEDLRISIERTVEMKFNLSLKDCQIQCNKFRTEHLDKITKIEQFNAGSNNAYLHIKNIATQTVVVILKTLALAGAILGFNNIDNIGKALHNLLSSIK